ncbi:hypothetical protein Cs7R123_64070 [Catellatospora sp. TT07R-123]|nr:hypothetical protein Cs7R123_64070 [Catellatospora sp. TT07R-123]
MLDDMISALAAASFVDSVAMYLALTSGARCLTVEPIGSVCDRFWTRPDHTSMLMEIGPESGRMKGSDGTACPTPHGEDKPCR